MSLRTFSAARALPMLALASAVGLYCGVESPRPTAQKIAPLVPTFSAQQTILASDKAGGSSFGFALALSRDGDTALVGSPNRSDGELVANGAAYVLTRSGNVWTEQQKLNASDLDSSANFGFSVALSRDGNTALIGAHRKLTSPIFSHGAAYVFTRTGTTWTEQQKLDLADKATDDFFGQSVALSGDGNTALIGARNKSESPNSRNGVTYVYTRSNGTWTQQQKLLAEDRADTDGFGYSVALSDDASVALIGADSEDESPNTNNGAAYVFRLSNGSFAQTQKLTALDRASNDRLGSSVSLSADGKTALIGARNKALGGVSLAGAAYVFSDSNGSFAQEAKLLPSEPTGADLVGFSVSISGSGNTALVSAHQKSDFPVVSNGAAYLFTRSAGKFVQLMKLSASDPAQGDFFGQGVALSRDGGTALVGAPPKPDNGVNGVGAVYAYVSDGSIDGTTCTEDGQCRSGSCSDGVCCDFNCSDGNDCRACVNALTGATTGTCARIGAAANYTCRAKDPAKICDIAETCSGMSDSCPADSGTPNTALVCRPVAAGKTCDTAETCNGSSPDCPADGFRAAGVVCRVSGGPCDVVESCSGSSPDCPPNRVASANTVCKRAGISSTCDPDDFCDGTRVLCPMRFAAAGTPCENGMRCSGLGLCR